MLWGAAPRSTQSLSGPVVSNWLGPGPSPQWNMPGTMKSRDRKSTRLNSSHLGISYAVFCLKKKQHVLDADLGGDQGSAARAARFLHLARPASPVRYHRADLVGAEGLRAIVVRFFFFQAPGDPGDQPPSPHRPSPR